MATITRTVEVFPSTFTVIDKADVAHDVTRTLNDCRQIIERVGTTRHSVIFLVTFGNENEVEHVKRAILRDLNVSADVVIR